jgi:hypothetical protein
VIGWISCYIKWKMPKMLFCAIYETCTGSWAEQLTSVGYHPHIKEIIVGYEEIAMRVNIFEVKQIIF